MIVRLELGDQELREIPLRGRPDLVEDLHVGGRQFQEFRGGVYIQHMCGDWNDDTGGRRQR
ncbi:hypothetical protein D3C87_2194180 [compost metagenome]